MSGYRKPQSARASPGLTFQPGQIQRGNSRPHITSVDGHLRMCRNLAAWPARRMAQMGISHRARQSTRLAFLRLLSSPVGLGPDKLLVYVFVDSGGVEFLDKTRSGALTCTWVDPRSWPWRRSRLNTEGGKVSIFYWPSALRRKFANALQSELRGILVSGAMGLLPRPG